MQTNDPNHPNETLTCEGRVLVPVMLDPKRVNFGRITRGAQIHHKTVTLVRGDGGPISPEVLPFRQAGLDAQICEIEPGELYELELTLEPPYPNKSIRQMLRLKTGLAKAPEMTLYVTGSITPRVTSVPSSFTFPSNREGAVEEVVHLRWAGGQAAKILEVSSNIPGATVRVDESGRMPQIVMTVPAGSKVAGHSRKVTIKTDDPEVSTFSIPVRFHAKAGQRPARLQRSLSRSEGGPIPTAKAATRLEKKKPANSERKPD